MPVEKEPVDIFDTSGTNPPEEEEAPKDPEEGDGDDEEEEEGDDEAADDDEDDEEDDEEGDDEDGDEDDDEEDVDPRDATIDRLKAQLKLKNKALREQRKANRTGKATSDDTFEAPYPDSELTLAKDLPESERKDMTEREMKLHDDNVKVKQRLNADAKEKWEKEQADKASAINPDELEKNEIDEFAKVGAKHLARNDAKLANKIIKKFNSSFYREGMTEEQVEDALVDAAKLVGAKPFKAPKYQTSSKGKAVKKANKGSQIDSVVNEVAGDGAKKAIDL